MRSSWVIVSLLCCIVLVGVAGGAARVLPAPVQDAEEVDLIIRDARIWPGKDKSLNHKATAIAINKGKIVAIGDDASIMKDYISTKYVFGQGQRLVPGFHDSHVHFMPAGVFLSQVDLKLCANEAEFGARLREYDQKLPKGRWLLGGNWDHDRTFAGVLPTAAMIDKYVSAERPVFLRRYDGHMALANTHAMKLAGITAASKDPNGGEIIRHPNSQEPTGALRDNAMNLVTGLLPAHDETAIVEGVRRAMDEARSVGVTSVDDMDGSGRSVRDKLWKHYQSLDARGELTLRIRLFWPIRESAELASLIAREGKGTGLAQLGGVKGFMDGSLGSSTAKMFDSYVHEQGKTGVWVTPPQVMLQQALAADKAGLQVVVHAIGDEANARLLDIFSEVAGKNGQRDRRFRIEHAQHLRREDYSRFAQAGVLASMQPYHVVDDGRWAEGRLGTERCSSSYAYRSLLDNGAVLSFGSDWAVAPLNPMVGIDAAVNRRPLDGKYPNGWFPAQKISVEEALHAYTAGAAYAMFAEKQRGTLAVGMDGDVVLLDRDILDPQQRDEIGKATVKLTVVAGKVVYQKE
ncbi:MAG: amidohydrolase [Gemmatales bacterium]